ncbi:hypothetical protein Tco_1244282 [Tanacetum coccineum]
MEQYLTHTDYALWEVIMNGDAPASIASVSGGPEAALPPKTTEQKIARRNELKAKSTLLLAIPDEHLLKFHGVKDAKTLWEGIKTRFQKLISQLEIHSEVISQRCKSEVAENPQLDNEDLEQIDTDDLEEMDLKWQVAMLTMRVECYNCHRRFHFARECRIPMNQGNRNGDNTRRVTPVETPANALVVTDGMGYDWSYQAEEGPTNFALMAFTSQSSSSSNTEYDQQRDVLNKANLEIIAYQLGLESLEARIVVHQKNEAVYEEDIAFLKYDVKVRDNSITELKNQLEDALKEKDDLKLKLEESSKKLTKLINSQISVNNKTGLSFDKQMNENELHDSHLNKSEVFKSVSDSSMNKCEEDNDQVNDRFKKVEGYHAVPPPYTGNYMPSRPDLSFDGLDDYVYKSKVSETITSVPYIETTASKTSKDSLEEPKTVRPSIPVILLI